MPELKERKKKMDKNISRRSFLKGAAASVAGVAAMGLVGSPILASAEENWDLETEVLVVGGGGTGVSAAAEAAAAGAKVLVLEKSGIVGGTSNLSGGVMQAAGTKYQKEFSDFQDDTPEKHAAEWIAEGEGMLDEALVTDLANGAPDCIDWLADACGIEWVGVYGHCHVPYVDDSLMADRIHYYKDGGASGSGGIYVQAVWKYAESLGAELEVNTEVTDLIVVDGKVAGVEITVDGETTKIKANKGVILCTAGIDHDIEMAKQLNAQQYWVETEYPGTCLCVPTDTGDGINMACWAGAAVQDGPWPTMMHPQAASFWHGPFLFVTPEGKRYMNEATWVQGKCIGLVTQAKSPYSYSIFDSNYPEYVLQSLPHGGGMFWDNFRFIGSTFEESVETTVNTIEEGVVNDPKNYFKADTLEELAEMIGVPKDTLLATVEHYNELCDKGEDTDFYKDQVFLTPIKEGPFYATRVGAGLLAVVGGLHIDDNNQVCSSDDEVIPGLYAVGNVSGDMYAIDYPINFMGNSHGRCLVGGYSVGTYLASL